MDDGARSPLQMTVADTLTLVVYDMERDARVYVTIDGDVYRLIPVLPQLVTDAVAAAINREGEQ